MIETKTAVIAKHEILKSCSEWFPMEPDYIEIGRNDLKASVGNVDGWLTKIVSDIPRWKRIIIGGGIAPDSVDEVKFANPVMLSTRCFYVKTDPDAVREALELEQDFLRFEMDACQGQMMKAQERFTAIDGRLK